MISNIRELNITRLQLAAMRAVKAKNESMIRTFGIEDGSYVEAVDERIALLERKIDEYESLTRTEFSHTALLVALQTLPELLIKGRLTCDWSACQLERRTSVQNIDRHERNGYQHTRFKDVLAIATILAETLEVHNERIRARAIKAEHPHHESLSEGESGDRLPNL